MKREEEFLNELLKQKDTIIVACSGGPDSMCLLYLVNKLKEKLSLKIICAHVNHNKRVESKEEYNFVEKYCKENNIIFEGTEFKEYQKGNFHKIAHQKRQEFYEKLIEKYHANYMMTAHHGDDLIETILMRLTRGGTINTYHGFSKIQQRKNYTFVRPLITTTKSEIAEFDKKHNIPYVMDQSNDSDDYTRNRFRHHVLPFLKEENSKVHQNFLRFEENMCRINEFIVKYTQDALTKCLQNDTLLIVEMRSLDVLIQGEVIKEYLHRIYKNEINNITEKHVHALLDLISNKKSVGKLSLPKKYTARKSNNLLRIEKDNKTTPFQIELKEEVIVNHHIIKKVPDSCSNSNNILRLNKSEIKWPLYVRNRKNGDVIETKNLNGHGKVKKIFIDHKIPETKRDGWPILVDREDNIIWIPGLKKSKFDKEINGNYDIIYKYEIK